MGASNKPRILLWIGSLCLLALFGAIYLYNNLEKYLPPNLIPPDAYWVDMKKPLRAQTRQVEVAGVVLDIPQMYFDTRLQPGLKQESILLEVVWPEMLSSLELKTKQEYEKVWRQEHRGGWILLEAAKARPGLDVMVKNREQGLTKKEEMPSFDGLEASVHYHGKPEKLEPWQEMYLIKNSNGKVIEFISCSIKTHSRAVPICKHKFTEGSFLYDITYHKEPFFLQWAQQKQRAISFIRSFEMQK